MVHSDGNKTELLCGNYFNGEEMRGGPTRQIGLVYFDFGRAS